MWRVGILFGARVSVVNPCAIVSPVWQIVTSQLSRSPREEEGTRPASLHVSTVPVGCSPVGEPATCRRS